MAGKNRAPNTSRAEWIVAAASAALVLAVLGFLIYDGMRRPLTAPDITLEVDSIGTAGPGFLVLIRVHNRGRSTAADVLVEGELQADTGRVETSETIIDYAPGGGEVQAGLYFAHDPRQLRLRLRAHGFREP
ncbi:MAG TPA: hypothetical protein VFH24_04585 [Gemmatimonadales bacterium]|nr:hypothetical protein [Gemmatimonadales bacterium]